MKIDDAIKLVLDGRGLLFTGAGFSYGAKNLLGKPIPAGRQLAEELISAAGVRGQAELDRAAAAFLKKKTPDDLVKLLKDNYTVASVTESHKIISELNWMRVYTTNYDLVYEKAREARVKPIKSITAKVPPDGLTAQRDLVVHINGSVELISKQELHNSFKLTSASYAAESFEESGWAFNFRNDARSSSVILFIGYSLYDLDIARILLAEDVTKKAVFIVAPPSDENELEALELQDFGSVYRIGIDAFAQELQRVSHSYVPINAPLLLSQWERVEPPKTAALPSDKDVIEYLTEGVLGHSILSQINTPPLGKYMIPRTSLVQLRKHVLEDKKHIVLHGILGCGKSHISDAFGLLAHGSGWNVYIIRAESKDEIKEVQEIIEIHKSKILLIVDSYHRHMNLIRWIGDANLDNVLLFMTSRTDVHEIFGSDVSLKLKGSYMEIDCSQLDNTEVDHTATLLDTYGLWGQNFSWSVDKKQNYIKSKCSRELPSILVDILKAKHITEKYRDIVSTASDPLEIQRILVCLFVLEVMNYYPSTYLIQELLGGKNIKWSHIKTYSGLKSIIDFGTNTVKTRSAVLGRHLLHTLFTPRILVTIMTQIAKEADNKSRMPEFRNILKDLMRFKHVSMILPDKQKLQSTVTFYESIKNLESAKKEPLFWMQYGIASLTLEQMDRAEKYFEDAYSLASTMPGYDCYQIDNHFARYLLAKALLEDTKDAATPLLDKAKTIILTQMKRENRHYPFRAALGIFKVYEKWQKEWTGTQIKFFNGVFVELERRCLAADTTIRNNKYVLDCAKMARDKISSLGILQRL